MFTRVACKAIFPYLPVFSHFEKEVSGLSLFSFYFDMPSRHLNNCLWLLVFVFAFCGKARCQETLPSVSVNAMNQSVIVSWLNEYKKPITNILIQRSFDSTKHFTTIGSVLTPQNLENGYPDRLPPYDRMYYRVMIQFEGGEYVLGPSKRAYPEKPNLPTLDVTLIPVIPDTKKKNDQESIDEDDPVFLQKERASVSQKRRKDSIKITRLQERKINSVYNTEPIHIIETTYPSSRVFTNKHNVVVIAIQQAYVKKYGLKVFDENQKLVLELKRVPDDYLMLEKSNFIHSGWFTFEIYEEGKLFEKNKFFISKDKVKMN